MKRQIIRITEQDLHRIIKESVNKILRESLDNAAHYWKIDLIDYNGGSNSGSICVRTMGAENEDSIVNLAMDKGLIDTDSYNNCAINAEEITDDQYEMNFWSKYAVDV